MRGLPARRSLGGGADGQAFVVSLSNQSNNAPAAKTGRVTAGICENFRHLSWVIMLTQPFADRMRRILSPKIILGISG